MWPNPTLLFVDGQLVKGPEAIGDSVHETGNYEAELLGRQIDWLTCMINSSDERVTFDLRLVTAPSSEVYTYGRIRLALLCGIDSPSPESATERAIELLRLTQSFFEDEYELALITEPAGLISLLQPFTIRTVAEIARRAETPSWTRFTPVAEEKLEALPHRSPPR